MAVAAAAPAARRPRGAAALRGARARGGRPRARHARAGARAAGWLPFGGGGGGGGDSDGLTSLCLARAAEDVEGGAVPPPSVSVSDEDMRMRNVEFTWGAESVRAQELNDLFDSVGFARREPARIERGLGLNGSVCGAEGGTEGADEGDAGTSGNGVVSTPPAEVRVLCARAVRDSRGTPAGTLLGFARATTDGALCGCMWDVAVAPAWQRLGIGRALVERLGVALAEDGVSCIALYSEPGAVRMYEKVGFVRAGVNRSRGSGAVGGATGMVLTKRAKDRLKREMGMDA